ncbi:regulating synaptic membrane exocytosis protein 2-like [Schistocerca serialis cubense]|uniref:regulating synaptic membrane exocytosis protein 2-like n=1 Tax=Schistocerca serialis cubense TaxID=2023355 RepID=UPI00214E049E|nr:regulating synaptic membrane exocytosis protein 2-like [Schistocerca serialis cubense]
MSQVVQQVLPTESAHTVDVPEVDLSHLSDEERAKIQSVMAKAQLMDKDPAPAPPPVHTRREFELPSEFGARRGMDFPPKLCSHCRQREASPGMGQDCTQCRKPTCNTCGSVFAVDNKRPEWLCNTCIKKMSPMGWQGQDQLMSSQHQAWESHMRVKDMRREPAQRGEERQREYPATPSPSPPASPPPPPPLPPPPRAHAPAPTPEQEEDDDDDEEAGGGAQPGPEAAAGPCPGAFLDRSPGEVYTIPEEEEEAASPTSGDGVTSLRQRRLAGGGCAPSAGAAAARSLQPAPSQTRRLPQHTSCLHPSIASDKFRL